MDTPAYRTRFGSLLHYEKGGVQAISDDVKNYAFSNCFEIASKSKPYEKVVFGQNQIYVLECLRSEGTSPWFTCAHDEFALVMSSANRRGRRWAGEARAVLTAATPRSQAGW